MNRRTAGFTLVEAVISITLAAALLAMLVGTLRLSERAEQKGRERQSSTQRGMVLMDRISWLLRGAYPYFVYEDEDTHKIFFSGSSSRLGFVTTATETDGGGIEDLAGLKWVELSIGGGLMVKESIYFLEKNLEYGGTGKYYILDPAVTSISFEYMDLNPDTGASSWVASWEPDEREYLPSAVRVGITFIQDGKEVRIPGFTARIMSPFPEARFPAPTATALPTQ